MRRFLEKGTNLAAVYAVLSKSSVSRAQKRIMAEIRIDLYRDFADAIRYKMTSEGYDIASVKEDDEAAIRLCARLSRRMIAPRPRQILKASNFDPMNYEDAIAKLENAIRTGANLSPYMSKTTIDAESHDSMLDHWGIYHFHLGTELEETGNFIRRTGDILLCRIDDNYAYFIVILPHGRNVPAPWYRKELIEIIHKNWSESIRHALATGVTEVSPRLNDQEVAELRRKTNLVLFLEMSDGTVYIPPGVGNTLGLVATDGSSINDTRFADQIHQLTKMVEERIVDSYLQIHKNARQLGYQFNEPVSFVLAQTQPGVYWDILEPNSHFRIRIWQDDLYTTDSHEAAWAAGT